MKNDDAVSKGKQDMKQRPNSLTSDCNTLTFDSDSKTIDKGSSVASMGNKIGRSDQMSFTILQTLPQPTFGMLPIQTGPR